jgi:hypothetical protein
VVLGGAGRHTLRQAEDQSCMGQAGRRLWLLQGGCRQEALDKERRAACKSQVDLEVGMGLHCTPGEDMAPWPAVVDTDGLGPWTRSTLRSLSSCARQREQGEVCSNTGYIVE